MGAHAGVAAGHGAVGDVQDFGDTAEGGAAVDLQGMQQAAIDGVEGDRFHLLRVGQCRIPAQHGGFGDGGRERSQYRGMTFDIHGIHHTGIVTRELDGLERRYTALGFMLSPRSRHLLSPEPGLAPVPTATANHCAIFGNSYIELLGIVDESAPDPWHSKAMGEGFRLLNLGSRDAATTNTRLSEAGLRTSGVLELEREVDTEQGPRTMRARAVHVDPRSTPEGFLGLAQHLTREYIHQPRYLTHPNGARDIGSVLIVAEAAEFDPMVRRYADILGSTPHREGPVTLLETGPTRMEFVRSDHAAEVMPDESIAPGSYLAAMTILVDDAEKAREIVEDSGTFTHRTADGFFVSGHDAYGAALFFAG